MYLLYAFLALNLIGSLAGSLEKLYKIKTRLNKIQMEEEIQQNTSKALLAKLRKLIPQDLQERLAKIENQQQVLQQRIKDQHKMIRNNMEIQKILKVQLNTIQKLIPQDNAQRLSKIEAQALTTQKDIHFQLTNIARTLAKIETRQRFKAIGLKFYYIEDILKQNWTTAAQSCRLMGGNLASIQNNEEFLAIKEKVNSDFVYWLDINDHNKKGNFMSAASGKSVTFFKWLPGEPLYDDESQRYVNLFNGGMRVENGSIKRNFICQYDD